jgi:hypothetical protein
MAQLTSTNIQGDLLVSGNANSGTLVLSGITSNNYTEGIRICKASDNWGILVLGCNSGTTNGAPSENGGWFFGCNPSNQLIISNVNSNNGSGGLYIDTDSSIHAVGTITASAVYNAVYNDYAEAFTNTELIYNDSKHKIVELDENNNTVLASDESTMVIGVVSDSFGHMMGATQDEIDNNEKIPVGLAGVLYVDSIDAVNIKNRGKFIVSAGNGYGKVSDNPKCGTCVGKIIGIDKENNRYKIILNLK